MGSPTMSRAVPTPLTTAAVEVDASFRAPGMPSPRSIIALRLLIIAAILLAWELAPVSRGIKFWLSSPSLILATLWGWIRDGSLWAHLGATLSVMGVGYVVGVLSGIGLGMLFGFLPRLYRVLSPFVFALYALPKIALAPLFIILLGIGMTSKVALVAITVFFLLLNNTIDGVRDVDKDLVESLRLMGATRLEVLRKVLMPSALPWIFTGARISVRYAFTATLLAELIASNRGLGFLIEFNSGNFNATGSYAAIVVLVAFSVALTELLTRLQAWSGRHGR
jgi:NitT/TauT family transport system permease protein